MYRGNPSSGKYSVASVYAHVHMLVFSQYWISCPLLCPLSDMLGLGLCKSRFFCQLTPWYALPIKGHWKPPERKEEEERTQFFLRLVSFRDNPAVIVFYTSSSWFLFVVPATFLELVGLCSLRPTSTRQRAPCLGQSQLQLRSPQLLYCNNSNLYPLLFTPYGWQLLSTAALSMIF